MSDQLQNRWKIDKTVSVGDLVAIGTALLAIVYAYSTLDKRMTVIEEKIVAQAARDSRQEDDALRYQSRFDAALTVINTKLDRLIERGH